MSRKGKGKGRAHLQAVHAGNLVLEQLVDDAVLLDHRETLEGRVGDGDGIEATATTCSWRTVSKPVGGDEREGEDEPETSCTSTFAPSNAASILSFRSCSPSESLGGVSRRGDEDEKDREWREEREEEGEKTGRERRATLCVRRRDCMTASGRERAEGKKSGESSSVHFSSNNLLLPPFTSRVLVPRSQSLLEMAPPTLWRPLLAALSSSSSSTLTSRPSLIAPQLVKAPFSTGATTNHLQQRGFATVRQSRTAATTARGRGAVFAALRQVRCPFFCRSSGMRG